MNKILFAIALSAALPALCAAQTLTLYPEGGEGRQTSETYSVSVDGRSVWTEKIGPGGMEDLHVANFSCSGTHAVSVSVPEEVRTFSVQPRSSGVTASSEGNRIDFTIPGPGYYYIRINDLPYLAVFADSPQTDVPAPGSRGVTYYGPGTHEVGTITLKDDMKIYLAPGALLKARIRGGGKNVKIYGRGSLQGNISANGCERLLVEGIFIRSSGGWTNTLSQCTSTTYRDVKVFSHTGTWGLDGINPVTCDTFLIDHCFIRTRDDCIAIKAYAREGMPFTGCRNITVRRSVMIGWDHADGVTLGFELNGGVVENVLVTDCDILRARGSGRTGGHSAFSIVCDGPSDVRNITFDNIRVASEIEYKNLEIILTEGERYGNGKMGTIKGVHVSNVSWENGLKPLTIVGHPKRFVEDVSFTNCYIAGKLLDSVDDADFQIEYVSGLSINGKPQETSRWPLSPQGK